MDNDEAVMTPGPEKAMLEDVPRYVAADYFRTGVFAQAQPQELFSTYTCVQCGHRSAMWAAFKEHRKNCVGTPAGGNAKATLAELLNLKT